MRYFIHLSYLGKNFHGWQRQVDVPSIQAELEDSLSTILQTDIQCHGCGRTDKGVHARQYVCHFDIQYKLGEDVKSRLNKFLHKDIIVYEMVPVSTRAHAQLDVRSRTYRYYVHFKPDPFLSEVSSYYPWVELAISEMRKTLKQIQGSYDFRAFCLQPELQKTTVCTVMRTNLEFNPQKKQMYFEITADRFLRGMVRFLILGVLEVGWSARSRLEFIDSLNTGKEYQHRKQAYCQGLHLAEVTYADIHFTPKPFLLGLALPPSISQ